VSGAGSETTVRGEGVLLYADSREDAAEIQTISDDLRITDELFDGTTRRVRSDSRQRHRPVGSAIECDGLEDLPYARTIGNASHLAPGLPGKAGDKFQGQAASGAAWRVSLSKPHLHFFKELLPLRLRKTNDQSSEARQEGILVTRLQAHSR
jgi:hypothetical protein